MIMAAVRQKMPSELLPDGNCPRTALVLTDGPVDSHGVPESAAAAAETLVRILGQTRTVSAESSGPGHAQVDKRDPLGELVSVNLELIGLRSQPVFLSWSIFQVGGHDNLFGKWLGDFVAERLEATTNDDTGTVEMWIPLPRLTGHYFIRLSLTTDGASLASTDSDPFS